jgi:hypothetical protein
MGQNSSWWAGPMPRLKILFPTSFKHSNFENTKPNLPEVQNIPNFARGNINSKGTSFLLGRSLNS